METLNASLQWLTFGAECIMGEFVSRQQHVLRFVCCKVLYVCVSTILWIYNVIITDACTDISHRHECMIHTHTHTHTRRVRNHMYTQERSLAINHIHTHTHTPAAHTNPVLVQTQTPHASAPRSPSRRPQEQKKKQMGTSCLDESPGYTATVLHHTHAWTRTHPGCLTAAWPVLLLVFTPQLQLPCCLCSISLEQSFLFYHPVVFCWIQHLLREYPVPCVSGWFYLNAIRLRSGKEEKRRENADIRVWSTQQKL